MLQLKTIASWKCPDIDGQKSLDSEFWEIILQVLRQIQRLLVIQMISDESLNDIPSSPISSTGTGGKWSVKGVVSRRCAGLLENEKTLRCQGSFLLEVIQMTTNCSTKYF